jgi:hypothetical protein
MCNGVTGGGIYEVCDDCGELVRYGDAVYCSTSVRRYVYCASCWLWMTSVWVGGR